MKGPFHTLAASRGEARAPAPLGQSPRRDLLRDLVQASGAGETSAFGEDRAGLARPGNRPSAEGEGPDPVPEKVRRGWRPDPMWWLIVMWGLVRFTYFAVNLWVSGLHSYAGV